MVDTADRPPLTAEEMETVLDINRRAASKPVLSLVTRMLESAEDKHRGHELAERVRKLNTIDATGWLQLSFSEIEHTLNITLTITPRTYHACIDLPSADYTREVITRIQTLKMSAIMYWRQFCIDNQELVSEIAACLPNVIMDDLTVDENSKVTLYFDPDFEVRVGVFMYYVGPNGELLYKGDTK